jgi:acetyltransferase-like isoleucine patch superfamily enzyme
MNKIKSIGYFFWENIRNALEGKRKGWFSVYRNVNIRGRAKIHSFVLLKRVDIGDMSYVANFSRISNCRIGKFTSIGPNVVIGLGRHPTSWVSSHPAFFSIDLQSQKSFVSEEKFSESEVIEIGNDVWIGQGALILDGVVVGDGAIIGAGAVVTHNVPPFSVVVGVPAKIIKYRFSTDNIKFLYNLQWWNKDDDWLEEHASAFNNIEMLKNLCSLMDERH